jgi:hypothetical protein
MKTEPRFPRTTLTVTAGLLIWAADFLFIYVFAALACARGFAHTTLLGLSIVPLVSTIATAVAAVASGALIVAGARRAAAATSHAPDDATPALFLRRLAMIVAMLGLIAIALTGLPGLLVTGTCEM